MYNDRIVNGIAGAKLNLHLQVLNRRSDNFHNLLSIMAELEIHDLLKLESFDLKPGREFLDIDIVNSGGEFSSLLDEIPADKNLIAIAVKKYLKSTGLGGKIRFSLEKNIPSGAGLGGGSSDAACALGLVRHALRLKPERTYISAAEETGSDVPFFLLGGTVFAEGRGEILSEIDVKCEYPVILVNNGVHVNTGAAYTSLKRGSDNPYSSAVIELKKDALEEALKDISLWKSCFVNDFEEAVFKMHPELGDLKAALYELGADFALMSGSGSTVYGVYKNAISAEAALLKLKSRGDRAVLTKMRR